MGPYLLHKEDRSRCGSWVNWRRLPKMGHPFGPGGRFLVLLVVVLLWRK